MLSVVGGDILSNKVQVVTRVPNNPSQAKDPYYGKRMGTLNMLADKLRMLGEVRVASDESIKVQPWPESAAKYYFYVAGFTYCRDKQMLDFQCTYCKELGPDFNLHNIINHATLDTRAIIATNSARKEIILAFRGTQTNVNWAENLLFSHTPINVAPLATVHTGFKNIADAMAPEYIQALQLLLATPAYKDYDVVVTGHSLGGAVAQLASIQVHQDLDIEWERIKIVTFGQPRVGNIIFARWFNQKPVTFTRVVHENDLVPHVPPLFTGYIHTHLERYIENNSSKICNTDWMEDPTCSASRLFSLSFSVHSHGWDMQISNKKCN
ncbi:hypothetical protein DSO57_1020346 [Entomophthora muscae]|uniref:Uncharacterized protein n=2 Tax=Entomophthora muscae TaxID=34485 RepID=A0ACC2SDI5_9FUNG|nr:hypothetical protein DSO57_1033581 [Entomophthora muscae]KAJ9080867.1 hypothetical protein DSO57_1020346 [Entomophthora muscae]